MTVQRSKILAIDDMPINLLTLGSVLSIEFDLQIATSGAMGFKLAEETPPDLILLDVMMPVMDGYEVCRQFKADPRFQKIPIIFITAMVELNAEITGLSLGATDYITKPINIEIAQYRIRNVLEREHLLKEIEAYRDYLEELVQARTLAISVIQDAIIMINQNEYISFWNNAAERIFGYISSEAIGLELHELFSLPIVPVHNMFHELHETGKIKSITGITEAHLLRKDRKKITIEFSVSGVCFNGQWKIILVARDMTERKNTEYYIMKVRDILHKTTIPKN
ncbi:hypothetical protein CCP3SC5AM1_280007 [Gammaproteobacteria bacterium]